MKKSIAVGTLLLLTLFLAVAQEPTHRFEQISKDNGLSNNRVYSMIQDSKGFLWIGTLDGLNRYDGYNFKVYKNEPNNEQSISNNRVTKLFEDSKGFIWLAGKSTGANRFDPKTETFKRYNQSESNDNNNPENGIHNFFEIDEDFIVTTSNFTYKYNYQNESFAVVEPVKREVQKIITHEVNTILESHFNKRVSILSRIKDKQGNIWIGTENNGLVKINTDGAVTHFKDIGGKRNSINVIFEDNTGMIWIGTRNQGLFKYPPSSEIFFHYQQFVDENSFIDKISVRAITKDPNNNIWIGTASDGVIKFNATSKTFRHYQHSPQDTNTIPHNKIRSLYTDSEGNVWIGSYKGLSKYNTGTDNFQNFHFYNRNRNDRNYSQYRAYNIQEDDYGNLWIANWENLVKFNLSDYTFKIFSKDLFSLDNIRSVFVTKNSKLWIAAEFGGIACLDILSESLENNIAYLNKQLPDQNVFDIYEDTKGLLWVATFNGLCSIDKKTNKVIQYSTITGMPSNMSYGILEDKSGNIWVTTSNGLAKILKPGKNILTFSAEHGLQSSEFLEGAFYSAYDKSEFIIGGSNGINVFNPDNIKQNAKKPEIVFTSLMVLNKEVLPNQEVNKKIILDKTIEFTDHIELNRLDKIVSFEFSALHYMLPAKNQYAYKLEGFDDEWIKTDASRRFASYSNLNPGTYLFKVKAANCDGIWNEEGISISLDIKAPIWRTFWFYLLVFGIVAYGVYLLIKQREKQSKEINQILEQKVKDGEEVLNQKIKEVQEQKAEIEKRNLEEKELKYFNEGLARFSEIIGKYNDNIDNLCKNITTELMDYLEVEMVNIYIHEDDNENVEILTKKGNYTNHDEKRQYLIGEGIPGTCYKKNNPIIIDNLPKNERILSSSLGKASLSNLIAVPIAINNLKTGVLELASLNKVPDYQLKLVYKLSENLTSTIEYIKSNKEVAKLLEESKLNAENISAQDEELRQNLEELSSIQENFASEKDKLIKELKSIETKYKEVGVKYKSSQIALKEITKQFTAPVYIKDLNDNIIACNEPLADKLGFKTPADVPQQTNPKLAELLKSVSPEKVIKLTGRNKKEIGEIVILK